MEKTFIVMFIIWATCVQTSPERFATWVLLLKLVEAIYRFTVGLLEWLTTSTPT